MHVKLLTEEQKEQINQAENRLEVIKYELSRLNHPRKYAAERGESLLDYLNHLLTGSLKSKLKAVSIIHKHYKIYRGQDVQTKYDT